MILFDLLNMQKIGLNVKQFPQVKDNFTFDAKLLKLILKTDFSFNSTSYDAEKQTWAQRSVASLRVQVVSCI